MVGRGGSLVRYSDNPPHLGFYRGVEPEPLVIGRPICVLPSVPSVSLSFWLASLSWQLCPCCHLDGTAERYFRAAKVGAYPSCVALAGQHPDRHSISHADCKWKSFYPQAQITWDGNPLPTTFIDSHHLQTAITQQTFISFEAFVGNSVQIAVSSQLFFEIWDVQSAGTRPHPS
jgi:hypothetical protein